MSNIKVFINVFEANLYSMPNNSFPLNNKVLYLINFSILHLQKKCFFLSFEVINQDQGKQGSIYLPFPFINFLFIF